MRIFAVLSGKGGVGKTTTVANLSAALAARGARAVAVDLNWTTPNLGFHLGLDRPPATLEEVLAGRRPLGQALLPAAPGLRCLLPSPGAPLEPPREGFAPLLAALRRVDAEFALLDCPPGLEPVRSVLPHADGGLVVTNPEVPAMADALVTVRQARETTRLLAVELNRARWRAPGPREVERFCSAPVAAVVPESRAVSRSIASGRPAVLARPWSRVSRAFLRAAEALPRLETARRAHREAEPRRDLWARLESLQRRMAEASALRRRQVLGLLDSLEEYRKRGLLSEAAYQELRRVNEARLEVLRD